MRWWSGIGAPLGMRAVGTRTGMKTFVVVIVASNAIKEPVIERVVKVVYCCGASQHPFHNVGRVASGQRWVACGGAFVRMCV